MSELFDIKLETDLSEFDSVVADGGDLFQTTPGLANSAGKMALLIDDTNSIYGIKDFTTVGLTDFRARLYIDPNSLVMATSDRFYICAIRDGIGPSNAIYLQFNYDGTNYQVRLRVLNDGGAYSSTAFYDLPDAETYIEMHIVRPATASSNDGTGELFFDGVSQEQLTGLDNFDRFPTYDRIRVGAVSSVDAGTSGTFYLDEIVVRDDSQEIGQAEQPPVLQPVTLRRLVHFNYSYLLNYAFGIGSGVYTLSETTVQLCLTLLSTFPTWRDHWVGYDGSDWNDKVLGDIVTEAIGELIPD